MCVKQSRYKQRNDLLNVMICIMYMLSYVSFSDSKNEHVCAYLYTVLCSIEPNTNYIS